MDNKETKGNPTNRKDDSEIILKEVEILTRWAKKPFYIS